LFIYSGEIKQLSLRKFFGRHHDLVNRCRLWTCSVCRSHNHVTLSSFITYHWILNTTNPISEAGTTYHSGAPEVIRGLFRVCITRSSVFIFYVYGFVNHYFSFRPFSFGIVLSVLRFIASNYPFGIFNLYSQNVKYVGKLKFNYN